MISYASHSIPLSLSSAHSAFLSSSTIYMLQIVRPNNMVFDQTQIMDVSWVCCSLFLHLAFFVTPFPILVNAQRTDHLTINYPISWTNKKPTGDFVQFNAGIILATRTLSGLKYDYTCGCGFFCNPLQQKWPMMTKIFCHNMSLFRHEYIWWPNGDETTFVT